MGLHPRAISVVVLMVFELMKRGYRVCLSTHSPQVLEAVWVLRHLKARRVAGGRAGLPLTPPVRTGYAERRKGGDGKGR